MIVEMFNHYSVQIFVGTYYVTDVDHVRSLTRKSPIRHHRVR